MRQANVDVRQRIKAAGLRQWQVADRYGVLEQNFTKLLRKELPEQVKARIFKIIEELKTEEAAELRAAQ